MLNIIYIEIIGTDNGAAGTEPQGQVPNGAAGTGPLAQSAGQRTCPSVPPLFHSFSVLPHISPHNAYKKCF